MPARDAAAGSRALTGGRWGRALPPLAVLFLATLAFYARALDRPFTSEDFLLIRFLAENPPWRDLRSLLAAPWLEISVVKFYRPVATLLYGVEISLFGGRPLSYNAVHLLVHVANAGMVWAIARRLGRGLDGRGETLAPFAAALLFALYPLHPNAVVFSASFATLFGAAFFLAAFLFYLRFREGGSFAAWTGAMGFFVLALGSYEAAAVLPALLAAYDHAVLARAPSPRRHLALLPGSLPFFGMLGLYLLLRRWIFGVFVGGYEEYSQRLLAPQLRQIAEDLATSVHQLHLPAYEGWPRPATVAASCAALIGAPLVFWLLRGRSLDTGHARLWLFSWVWILLAQAPFAFRPSVPGNGRYWYLAAAGVAMSAAFLARGVFAATRPPWRNLAPAAVGLLAVVWCVLLGGYVETYVAAGRTARRLQGELLRVGRTPAAGAEMFVTRYPYFLLTRTQVPVAQVYHYGLWDSVHPPFVRERIPLYPLPPLAGAELLPVTLGAQGGPVFEWRSGSLRRFAPPAAPALPEFQVLRPAPGAAVEPGRDAAEVAVPPGPHARFRLLLATRINGAVFDLGAGAVENGVLRADFPAEILTTSDRLYGRNQHFWWIEARDAAGNVSGFSRMRGFHLAR
jgi:hypothetical protein